jgi:hypothetical protein
MDKIPEQKTDIPGGNTYYVTQKTITANGIINKALWSILTLLVVSILATFFVKDLPGFALDIRSFAIDGLWVMVGCYSIGEVLKRIFRNKGKSTKEYDEAQKEAKKALDSLTEDELAARAEYCTWYEDTEYERAVKRLLSNIGMKKEEYLEKYTLLSKKELKERYGNSLTKKQIKTLSQINSLERVEYDPSFFLYAEYAGNGRSPSQAYNADREDKQNSLISLITSFGSGLFAVTFAGELVLSFSLAVLFSAIVKLTITAIIGAFKANFGWNLSMRTDIGRFNTQVKEVANLKKWYADNKKC